MELKIDGRRCDLAGREGSVWSWEAATMSDPEALREGQALVLDLPSTRENDDLFDYAVTPHMSRRFNRTLHRAELTEEGELLFAGAVRLLACRPEEPEACYRIEIRCGAAEWARRAAEQPLEALEIPFEMRLTPAEICNSWSGEADVRFLPVVCDDYRPTYSSSSLLPVERMLSVDDYHPFIRLKSLVEAIFAGAGYTLDSDFVGSPFFGSLYMSGAYARRDTSAVVRRMGFFARRQGDAEAAANFSGRVYASPSMPTHSVGNIVDALSPQCVDAEGNPLTDAFSTGGYLRLEEGRLLYRPPSQVEVGFEYGLVYETDYRIRSRSRLTGFDSVYLGTGADMSFELPNRFADRRGQLTGGQSYRAMVFDHAAGDSYRLVFDSGKEMATFAGRTAVVTAPTAVPGVLQLYVRSSSTEAWRLCDKDWALYDGHVGETGSVEVELNLRTAPETAGPADPKRFETIYFYGAEPGMKLRLKQATTLRPYFSSRPGYGSRIVFADIARHALRQSELLSALAHLFNWRFFTDEERKRVRVEPAAEFYRHDEPVDWSDRMVEGETVVEETDGEEHEARVYGYLHGDGAVERFNRERGEHFGEWTVRSSSKAALRGIEQRRNPLFAPTLVEAGHRPTAPSALVPVVGDRDDTESVDEFRFTPRILRYAGLRDLEEGERWGSPAPEGRYPFAAFHFAGDPLSDGFTLCFEDREGQTGLHRFYDGEEAVRDRGLRLRTTLRLTAREAAGLRGRSRDGLAGIDSLFRLRVGGEPVRCRLEAVERYDPQSGCARCRFTLVDDDRP